MTKDIGKSSLLSKWKNKQNKPIARGAIEKAPRGISIPLSYGQKRLWFLQQLDPENAFYNYAETYIFEGVLNRETLIESLKTVYRNHDVLKTTYHIENGEVFQKINKDSEVSVAFHDLTKLPKASQDFELNKLIEADSLVYFDLSKHPLVRFTLVKTEPKVHILQITIHHIATDKWSMRIFREHLAKCYRALTANENLPNIKSEIQYADYSYWLTQQETDTKQLEYWKRKLAGDNNTVLNLPTDFNRPSKRSFKGAVSDTYVYDDDLSSRFLKLSAQLNATPYVVMLSAYYVFLNQLSNHDTIFIGTPVTNRNQKTLEDLIGFFNDTVVLKTSLNKDLTFSRLVEIVKRTTLEAFANKDVSFDVLVKALDIERSLSHNPLFQVMFLYHVVPENPFFDDNVKLKHTWYDLQVAKFDLTLYTAEENGIISTTFEYSTDLFKAATIQVLHQKFQKLLKNVVSSPNKSISEHLYIKNIEVENSILDTSLVNYFKDYKSIHGIIENNASKTPNAIALSFNEQSLTYFQLNERAKALAQTITTKISSHNEIIGLCINRSMEMIIGMLAILKSGCAYLPIDPDYPEERIKFILEDAKASIIVAQNSTKNLFEDKKLQLVNIDEKNRSEAIANTLDFQNVQETDLAYVIYTSGSTGKPKGVPITHKNIINSTSGRLEFYNKNPDAFLLMSSIAFDSSKAGIFWTLCTGGNLVITEKRIEQDIDKISETIEKHKITHTLMLPSLYNLILNYAKTEKLKSLNTAIVAGEACNVSLCNTHFSTLPNVSLVNEYGPTEATVWCIAHKITHKDLTLKSVPIGTPVANSEIYILDNNLREVKTGDVGEIFIGGCGLSNGYINREDLTAKAFIKSPFLPNKTLYKTGDLGKYNDDGKIEFLGRKDQQIKIRGFRVEIDEIEKTINDSDMVHMATVVVESTDDSEFSLERLENSKPNELSSFIKSHLNEHEVKSLFVSIASLNTKEKANLLDQMAK